MKKVLKIIGYTAVFAIILLSSSHASYAQEEDCVVENAIFLNPPKANTNHLNYGAVSLEINVNGCDDGISLRLYKMKKENPLPARIDNIPGRFYPNQEGNITIRLGTGEDVCYTDNDEGTVNWGYECISYIEVLNNESVKFSGSNDVNFNPNYIRTTENIEEIFRSKGVIIGQCSGAWCSIGDLNENSSANWKYILTEHGAPQESGSCNIEDGDVFFTNFSSNYIEDSLPILHVKTPGCEGIPLEISIVEEDVWWTFGDSRINIDFPSGGSGDIINLVPNENLVSIPLKSNKSKCDNSSTPNCRIYVHISYPGGSFSTEEFLDDYDNESELWLADKTFITKGVILANCTLDVFDNPDCGAGALTNSVHWKLLGQPEGAESLFVINNPNVNILDLEQSFDPESPCYVDPEGSLGDGRVAGPNGGYHTDCYELLAPIPGVGIEDGNSGRYSINFSEHELGDYINTLFQVALGILMVLAVIMIVVAGVEYMTVESIYGKGNAKGKITSAITGLILALGIFIILNTINPRLLEINFGTGIDIAQIGIDHPQGGDGYATPGGTIEEIPAELMSTTPEPGKIYCPGTGGQDVIPDIAQSFIDVSTYRYGAKGSHLAPGEVYQDGPDKICENNVQCRTFCPENSFCVDCSGFVNHVLKCAGVIDNSLGNTASIFQGVAPFSNYNPNNQTVDGYALQVGDLVGEPGHVGIYVGDGNIVESTASQNGRFKNNNTQKNSFNERRPVFIKQIRKFDTL